MTFLHWPRFFDASRRDMQVIARRGPERQKTYSPLSKASE
jgi:hypothetical protein